MRSKLYVHKLYPQAIKQIWSQLKYGLEKALPPTSGQDYQGYTSILAALLSEKAQCWVVYSQEENTPKLHGFVVSMLRNDPLTKNKYLHLYAIYAFRPLTEQAWTRLYACVNKFAKAQGCSALTSFTNNDQVAKQFARLGGKTDWQYWYKEI